MFGLIIFIVIFYIIYKRMILDVTNPMNLKSLLEKKGFRNISTALDTSSVSWITADFHGDNYIFLIVKNGHAVSKEMIKSIYEYTTPKHYHNIILVSGNAHVLSTARTAISKYNIKVWTGATISSFSNATQESIINSVTQKAPIEDNCDIEPSFDPIQDGTRANSIFGNFFGNKIEKL